MSNSIVIVMHSIVDISYSIHVLNISVDNSTYVASDLIYLIDPP